MVISTIPIATMPPLEETPVFQTLTPLLEQLVAHQEE
jgi:hypothetical protein